jgi:hypothetical protein
VDNSGYGINVRDFWSRVMKTVAEILEEANKRIGVDDLLPKSYIVQSMKEAEEIYYAILKELRDDPKKFEKKSIVRRDGNNMALGSYIQVGKLNHLDRNLREKYRDLVITPLEAGNWNKGEGDNLDKINPKKSNPNYNLIMKLKRR